MAKPRLTLLSLNGGGVRGLSSLAILKQLMVNINPECPPLPCDYFDMIGGTSTGGLIAIMLGRLGMSVDECMDTYARMSDRVFSKRRHRLRLNGQVQGRFDSEELAKCVKELLVSLGMDADALLKEETGARCKVFVCATSAQTRSIVHLRSYRSPRGRERLYRATKIWEACRATCAASSFFDPITIGDFGESFVDGATGANNPVTEVWNEAKDVWTLDRIECHLQCLVSIGTGIPSVKPFGTSLAAISAALRAISIETESTAEHFARDKSGLESDGRYYRFNVIRGLEGIGLEDSSQLHTIMAATDRYLESQTVYKLLRDCSAVLQSGRLESDQNHSQAGSTVECYKMAQEAGFVGREQDREELTPLHLACQEADLAAVRRLLKSTKVDLEKEDQSGQRPLHYAAAVGSVPACMALLTSGAIGLAQDHRGWTPAHCAAHAGHITVLQSLRGHGIDLHSPDDKGDAPCHIASQSGQLDTVAFLLESNVDIRLKNFAGETALQTAKKSGHSDIVDLINFSIDSMSPRNNGKAILHWAAENGQCRVLGLILDGVDDVDSRGPDNVTPLSLAAKNGHTGACEMLLDRGANTESKESTGLTPLHLASMCGHAEVAGLLLDKNANIEAECYQLRTPLLHAARHGKTQVVKMLLDRKCNVRAQDRSWATALILACCSNSIPCVSLILEQEPETHKRPTAAVAATITSQVGDFHMFEYLLGVAGDIPEARERFLLMIRNAIYRGNDEMVKLTILKGADINAKDESGRTLLSSAIEDQSPDQVKALLRHDAVPSDTHEMGAALSLAARRGDNELAQLILSTCDLDINMPCEGGRPALSTAVLFEQKQVALLLLQHSANVNHGEMDETALHIAAESCQDDMVKILLEHGADVDCEDRSGDTPLYRATGRCAKSTVKVLLDAGADPNAGSGTQKALLQAVTYGDEQMVRWLLGAGASINEKDENGDTALEIAFRKSRTDLIPVLESHGADIKNVSVHTLNDTIPKKKLGYTEQYLVDLLIRKGVDVNGQDVSGRTPLIAASSCGDKDTVETLLRAGADPNLQDPDGYPPLYYAIVSEEPQTVTALLKGGASITVEDKNGLSAIEWVVQRRESDYNQTILDAILEKGPDVNRKARGLPLLYLAIVNGNNAYTVRRLIELGIDLSATSGGYQPTNSLDWTMIMGRCRAQKTIRDFPSCVLVRPLPGGLVLAANFAKTGTGYTGTVHTGPPIYIY
ncbi:FabD/lysophospholipase-like protein [Ilyonectria robusta]